MKTLYIIPARGGSKGIPEKNFKLLGGIPLINYTIDIVRKIADDIDICVSTDSQAIIDIVRAKGLNVPFKRPDYLATDTASSYDVIMHAIRYYESLGRSYDSLVLLQPTSPFRKEEFIRNILKEYNEEIDMVVSVKECHENPYFSIFEENVQGFLVKSKEGSFIRRQDIPKAFVYNGSIYLINIESLKKGPINQFKRVRKYLMDDYFSLDIDTPLDWFMAECLLKSEFYNNENNQNNSKIGY